MPTQYSMTSVFQATIMSFFHQRFRSRMTRPAGNLVTAPWIFGERKNTLLRMDVWECSVVFISHPIISYKIIITVNKLPVILASTQRNKYTYYSTWNQPLFPKSFLLASSDLKNFFIPTSPPFSPIRKAVRVLDKHGRMRDLDFGWHIPICNVRPEMSVMSDKRKQRKTGTLPLS